MTPERWLDHRVLVTVGTGGVGKTTVAAALGLEAARRGRRVLVLTIDPAQRLADALGVGALDQTEREVPRERVGGSGSGQLFAMMLDTQRTFDELVTRLAPDPEAAAQIRENAIYRNLSDALAGSREYSAMEKLHQLASEGRYDLIVLDTPPANHALDFLDAPRRLTGFLRSPILRMLLTPAASVGRAGFRLFRSGSELVLRTLERLTGLEFLMSVSEFLLAFESLIEGFTVRARQVQELLRGAECGFVLVAGPDPQQVERARGFWSRLRSERIRLVGLIVNRMRIWPDGPPPATDEAARADACAWLESKLEPGAPVQLYVDTAARHAEFARRDARMRDQLVAALDLDESAVRGIELMQRDVHAIDALGRMAAQIFEARNARL